MKNSKLKKLLKSGDISKRIDAMQFIPFDSVSELVMYEEDYSGVDMILKKLKEEKDDVITREDYLKLSITKNWKIRKFVAEEAPIDIVVQLAMGEEEYSVLNIILDRLKEEKDGVITREDYLKLSIARNWKVRKFVAKKAPIDIVVQLAIDEEEYSVLNIILGRLKEEKSDGITVEDFLRLSAARNWKIRKFVAEEAPIDIVVRLAMYEMDSHVSYALKERLKEEKDSEYVNNNFFKLIISKDCIVRKFVAEEAPIDIIVQLAINESDKDVIDVILERLKKEEKNDVITREDYLKLVKTKYWRLRKFVAKKAPIDIVVQLAVDEERYSVLNIILERLKEEKSNVITREDYLKLVEIEYLGIREFIAKGAPIDIIVQLAINESDKDVIDVILGRLTKEEKDSAIIREDYLKLSVAKHWKIRKFTAKNAPIDIVVQLAINENDKDVINVILGRLTKEEKDGAITGEDYLKLSAANNWKIREFTAKKALIDIVLQLAINEKVEDIINVIIERLTKENVITRKDYLKLTKAKHWKIRRFIAKEAPLDIALWLAIKESDIDVSYALTERLKEEKDSEHVNNNFFKLIMSKSHVLREFVAEEASIDIVAQLAVDEEEYCVVDIILKRLKEEKDGVITREDYLKLSVAKHWKIREFIAKKAPIDVVVQLAINEEAKDIINVIIKRLEKENEYVITREDYLKLTKAKRWEIREFAEKKWEMKNL